MKKPLVYVLGMLVLAAAYVAIAAINRHYSWAWGREWLAPTMMLLVLLGVLSSPVCLPRRARG